MIRRPRGRTRASDYQDFPPDRADLAQRLRAFIDYWHFETFYGSPLADDTDLWTLVQFAVQDLKARITSQI
jgi:hypothetical protein